uniref:Uncharacterized protein n=1 Tax=Zea mays TaxID=4577 RepID=C0PLG6_MAIZE|nr:unknown [Zea mays]
MTFSLKRNILSFFVSSSATILNEPVKSSTQSLTWETKCYS